MIRALRKTIGRTGRFLGAALLWRAPERAHALVAWGLLAGAAWLMTGASLDPASPEGILAAVCLVAVLAAVCAIDARYGIIPDSLVAALAIGGVAHILLSDHGLLPQRGLDAGLFLAGAWLFQAIYRWVRGHDGLGFGDVKFATAGVLWIGLEGVPSMLLIAVVSALASLVILKAEGHALDGRQAISFGPHLAVGLWLTWTLGPLFGV